MKLDTFLETKPLYYDVIDYTRMPKAYKMVSSHLKLPRIIHVVGTNGKGTTGRFLAQMLLALDFHVGHYTSPHILKFNERIWIDGKDCDDETLERCHKTLLSWLDASIAEALSYFEYTTLLAMVIFCEKCDYVVLEAGLGGEFDATNVFRKCVSIVTPIGLDHQSFLGESIEAIAQTKLNSIKTDFVIAKQTDASVYALAFAKAKEKKSQCYRVDAFWDTCTNERLDRYLLEHHFPSYIADNFKTALCTLTVMGYECDLDTFNPTILQGRCQKIADNITIDVGHNEMAARALATHFKGQKISLIYNSYKDKDYAAILKILHPIIDEILIITIDSPRAVETQLLYEVAKTLELPIREYKAIEEDKNYLVFGSFSVVEAFLKGYNER